MKARKRTTPKPKNAMTMKQIKFCEYYITDQNATQAAIRAGYSKKTAGVIGMENLMKPYIKDYIKKRQDEEIEKTKMGVTEILQELTKVARGLESDNIIQYNPDGTTTKTAKLQVKDRLKALELLGKTHKLFVDRTESTIKGEGVIINVMPASEVKKDGKDQ